MTSGLWSAGRQGWFVRWQCISNNCCNIIVVGDRGHGGDSVIVAGGCGHGEDSGSTVAQLVVWKEVMYKCQLF